MIPLLVPVRGPPHATSQNLDALDRGLVRAAPAVFAGLPRRTHSRPQRGGIR